MNTDNWMTSVDGKAHWVGAEPEPVCDHTSREVIVDLQPALCPPKGERCAQCHMPVSNYRGGIVTR